MRRSILILSVVILCFLNNPGYAATEIKIGQLLPLSGHPSAPIGKEIFDGTQVAIKHINEEGGIKSLGGATLKLVTLDTHGEAQNGMTLTERLINVEKVPLIMGAYNSAVTFPSTVVAEKYKIPWIVDLSAFSKIIERGFKYVFRPVQCSSPGMTRPVIDFTKWIGEKTGKPAKTIANVYENTAWGQDLAKAFLPQVSEAGLKLVLDEPYPAGSTNLMPIALKIKGANADIVSLASYVSDAILLTQLIAKLKIDSIAVIGHTAGFIDPSYIPSTGVSETNYVYATDSWGGYDACIRTPWGKKVWNDIKQLTGKEPRSASVSGYVVARIAAEAMERAKSADPEAIRNALSKLNIQKGELVTLMGFPFEFDEKGQNPHVLYSMEQIYGGKYHVVWPLHLVTDFKPIWPIPKWAERK